MENSIAPAKETRDVWVLEWNGVKCCVHLKDFTEAKKVLVEFHGVPEIVDADKVFATEAEVCSVFASKKQQEGMACLKMAQQYMAKAFGKVPGGDS